VQVPEYIFSTIARKMATKHDLINMAIKKSCEFCDTLSFILPNSQQSNYLYFNFLECSFPNTHVMGLDGQGQVIVEK
jgi:hypothetical protein